MAQPDIIVTAPLPPFLYDPLKADYRCHDYYASSHKPGLLAAEGARIRGLVQGGGTVTPASLLDALPKLEIISVFGVGYDGVPVDYCRQRGIKVTNTPDVLTDDVADLAIGLMLAALRGIATADRYVRAGQWLKAHMPLQTRMSGKRLGIVGMGRIGQAIARRAAAFDMRIAWHGPRRKDLPYRFEPDLVALAQSVDVLVASCPGGAATRGLIGRAVLEALGPRGFFVNIARGAVVDESALVELLASGRLGGAGLDVFVDEPNVPAGLLALDNVVLQPHVASATHETRTAMGRVVLDNRAAFNAGRKLPTPVTA
jgi:hypothetical protein